jgi:hypothetical protein
MTTPGAAVGNQDPVPELIKQARTMRFEGRFDKVKKKKERENEERIGEKRSELTGFVGVVQGGIGQQLVLAGFHSMTIEEKLKMAEELETVEDQVAPDAPQAHLDALIKIYEKPYAKWGPAYANQLLTMFPKPLNSPVGPAPCFK